MCVAFHAGNLLAIGKAFREKHPTIELVIAADNDQWTDGNPGLTKALEAAKAIGATVAVPRFQNKTTNPTDFNDLFCLDGINAVKEQLGRATTPDMLVNVPGVLAVSVKPRKVSWLWLGWIPRGEVTIVDGDPGVGKSAIAVELAACVTTGRAMPGAASGQTRPRGVVFVDLENSLAHTLVPRLIAAGADLNRIRIIRSIPGADGERTPEIPHDLAAIRKAIVDVDAALLVIDPLVGCLPVDTDAHRDQHVRIAMAPLQRMAEHSGIAILAIRHLNKNGSTKAVYRGGGSIAFIAGARAALICERDPNDRDWRVLAASKASLGPEPASLRFHFVPSGESGEITRVEWGDHSKYTAEMLLGDTGGEARDERATAREFLLAELEDGPVRAVVRGLTEKNMLAAAPNDCCRPRTELRRNSKLANATLKKIRDVMGFIFKHGQRYGLLPRTEEANPMKFVRQSSVSDYEPFVPTISQCIAILANLDGMHRVLVLADAATGLRISEILALLWSNIDKLIHAFT